MALGVVMRRRKASPAWQSSGQRVAGQDGEDGQNGEDGLDGTSEDNQLHTHNQARQGSLDGLDCWAAAAAASWCG